MSRVRVHPAAQKELAAAAAHYERQRPGLGADFIDAYRDKLEQALKLPQSGPRWPGIDAHDVRAFILTRFPFTIAIVKIAGTPTVIAVVHQHRRPGYWLRRLSR